MTSVVNLSTDINANETKTGEFQCEYTESTDRNHIISQLKILAGKINILNIKNGKEICPVIIGSHALLYKIERDRNFKKIYNENPTLYNIKPKDFDLIMTPSQALKIVKESSKSVKLYILNVDNVPYYKVIFEYCMSIHDITIITDAKQPMYKLAMYCQNQRYEYIHNMKMIYASLEVLHMLKSIHLFYKTDFEKHMRHHIILARIAKPNTDLLSIKNDFIKEARIIRGPINELPTYDQRLHTDDIVSYVLDKYLLSGLSDDIKKSYVDTVLLFCTSIGGDKYWKYYTSMLYNPLAYTHYDIRSIFDKIKLDRMDPYERYFSTDEIDQARKYGEPAFKTHNSILFDIHGPHTIIKNVGEKSIQLSIKYNYSPTGIFTNHDSVTKPLLTISWDSTYIQHSSSESTSYTEYTVSKYTPPQVGHDFALYLLRIAMIYLPVNPQCQKYYMSNGKDHPVVSIYAGLNTHMINSTADWENKFKLY